MPSAHGWMRVAALAALFCCVVAAQQRRGATQTTPPRPQASAANGAVQVPQIPFTPFTLPNGMRVILSPDHSLPVVTESMVFDVGSRDEHQGRSGFAHLFEHLMFEGSKDAPKGVFDRMVEGYGGNDNASTHLDYTYYYATVPSNVLPILLWLDADRLASLNVTQEAMKNQVQVVEEEKRLRVDNQPYGSMLYEDLGRAAFGNWQNSHSVIGSFQDLDAATLQDVQAFFDAYYAPKNAVLTIVGDFDPDATAELVKKYFAWIPNRGAIVPVTTTENPQGAENTITVHDAQAKLPAVAMAWQGPPRGSPDFYAITLLGSLLFSGESSLVYQSLVKTNQVAISVDGGLGFPNADYTDYKAPGLFGSFVVYKPTATPDQIEGMIFQQIQQVEATGVSPTDLDRVRTKFTSDWIRSEQTTQDRGQLLSLAALFNGKPDAANNELAKFMSVGSDDLAHAARTYLTHARASEVIALPGSAAAGAAGRGRGKPSLSETAAKKSGRQP